MKINPALLVGPFFLAEAAQAAVLYTFSEIDGDVVAEISGSFVVPGSAHRVDDNFNSPGLIETAQTKLVVLNPGSVDEYSGGSITFLGIDPILPDSVSVSQSFGFDHINLFVPGDAVPGLTIFPTGTLTWNSQTIEGIGLGLLVSGNLNPRTIYTGASGDRIQYVAERTIPEPSSSAIFCFALGMMAFIRKRP